MTKQLTIVPTPAWRFDAETRSIGLQGVAAARATLAAARKNLAVTDTDPQHTITEAA